MLYTIQIAEKCSGLSTSEARAFVLQKRSLMYFCNDYREALKNVAILVGKIVEMEEEIQNLKQTISKPDLSRKQKRFKDFLI